MAKKFEFLFWFWFWFSMIMQICMLNGDCTYAPFTSIQFTHDFPIIKPHFTSKWNRICNYNFTQWLSVTACIFDFFQHINWKPTIKFAWRQINEWTNEPIIMFLCLFCLIHTHRLTWLTSLSRFANQLIAK